ncbi:hypothetical protein D9M72_556190 [compost metagenome]
MQVIDLLKTNFCKLLHQGGHVRSIGHQTHTAEPAAHFAQCRQVDVDNRVDARALHLQDHALESGVGGIGGKKLCAVRLPKGCGSDWHLFDRGEDLVQRRAQLRLGKCADCGKRDRGHLVLQPLKFLGDLGRKHVESGRQELTHFDHQAAQVHRERVEALREAPHPPRPGALCNFA